MTLEDAFRLLPSFNTERLRIRPLEEGDAEAIFAIRSDHHVTERYGQEPHSSLDVTRQWIKNRIAGYGSRNSMFWVLVLKGETGAIGSCCFWNFDEESNRAELGYELHPAHWHKGLMTEALLPILAYGFQAMGLHRIEAYPLAENAPSNNLLLKLGFKCEGTLHQRVCFAGRYLDQLCYGMLREDTGTPR